jgi:mannose-6-phosphate isomerase-like protein (cupin superfamily)
LKATYLAAAAVTLLAVSAAHAQIVSKSEPRMTAEFWSAKPTVPTPYTAPNKVHWKYSEVLAAHRGQGDWTQPVVRNPDQEGDYISLGVGKSTKPKMYADDRIVFIVWDGSVEVTIEGVAPFVATKGFMVSVPYRHVYSLKNVGATPAVRFEVHAANMTPLYPATVTPDPFPGKTYMKVTGTPGPARLTPGGPNDPIYVDFFKDVAAGVKLPSGFIRDDNFTGNILRGKAAPVPPDSDKGHFHVDWTEFWFIMEGKIGYKIEGFDYFASDPGDVVIAAKGRWHRAGNDPAAPWSTRIPFNPRPVILHNWEPVPPAAK